LRWARVVVGLAGQAEALARGRAQVQVVARAAEVQLVQEVEREQGQAAAASQTLPLRQPARAVSAVAIQARQIRAQP
jgi:hypothetical protein